MTKQRTNQDQGNPKAQGHKGRHKNYGRAIMVCFLEEVSFRLHFEG